MSDTNPDEGVTPEPIEDRIEALLTRGSKAKEEPAPDPVEDDADVQASEDEPVEVVAGDETKPDAPNEDDQEVEFDGEVYVMPSKIKDALLRQSDYTRKTQEVAEQRKAVEDRAERLAQRERLMAAGFEKAVEMKGKADQLAQYEKLDWGALVDQDPAQASKLNFAHQQLQREHAKGMAELQQIEQAIGEERRQTQAKTAQEIATEMRKEVKDYSPATDRAMLEQASRLGYTKAQLSELSLPMVRAIYKSMKWDQLQASKSSVSKKVADVRSVPTTARSAQSSQADARVKDARQALAKSGSKDAAENYFERLLTKRR